MALPVEKKKREEWWVCGFVSSVEWVASWPGLSPRHFLGAAAHCGALGEESTWGEGGSRSTTGGGEQGS